MDKAPDAFRTISEVADDLDIPQHVLRFWETRFSQIKPMKRSGGRRYYRPDDVDLLRGIRRLLYGEGYTIRGVQRILREQGIKAVQGLATEGAPAPSAVPERQRVAAPVPPQRARPESEPEDDADEIAHAGDDAGDDDEIEAGAQGEDDEDAGDDEADEAADGDEDADDHEEDEDDGEDDEPAAASPARAAPPIPPQRPPGRDTSFTGRVEPVLRKAPVAPPVVRPMAPPPPPPERPREPPRAGLSAADAARLKTALDDLAACKRLIDDTLKGVPSEIIPLK